MNPTLKPHLLAEVMGLQRQSLPPEGLCMLFLSYRDFPDAFARSFDNRCEVRPQKPSSFKFWIQTPCGIIFNFAEELHIPILLRIAGRLTRRLEAYVCEDAWMEPFLEEIDKNQHIEFIHFRAGIHFLERYLRHHDNHLQTLECNRFSLLDELGDPYIEKLIVNKNPEGTMNKQCRVENIEVGDYVSDDVWESIIATKLKVYPKVWKCLTVRGSMSQNTAFRMITGTYSKLKRLQLDHVGFKEFSFSLEVLPRFLNRINKEVSSLKKAMHDHPGTVSVKAFYTFLTAEPGPQIADICRTTLTGFNVKTVKDSQGMAMIVCKLQWNEENHSLNARVKIDGGILAVA